MSIKRALAAGAAAIVGIGLCVSVLPPLLLRDSAAPASLAPFVDSARRAIRSESIEGPVWHWWPLHLRFAEARCSTAEPGRVALVFEEWRPPYLDVTYAVAWRESMPNSPDDGWGGGLGMRTVYDDDEWIYQMGQNTVACA